MTPDDLLLTAEERHALVAPYPGCSIVLEEDAYCAAHTTWHAAPNALLRAQAAKVLRAVAAWLGEYGDSLWLEAYKSGAASSRLGIYYKGKSDALTEEAAHWRAQAERLETPQGGEG